MKFHFYRQNENLINSLTFVLILSKNKGRNKSWLIYIFTKFFAPQMFFIQSVSFSSSVGFILSSFDLVFFLHFDNHFFKELDWWQVFKQIFSSVDDSIKFPLVQNFLSFVYQLLVIQLCLFLIIILLLNHHLLLRI